VTGRERNRITGLVIRPIEQPTKRQRKAQGGAG
jgi:hypothetical protein